MTTLVLEVTAGPFAGRRFELTEAASFILGRDPSCHLALPPDDHTGSRFHFLLELSPPTARVRDLGSRNGTFVNAQKIGGRAKTETAAAAHGKKFPEVELNDGDEIKVGTTLVKVRWQRPLVAETIDADEPAAALTRPEAAETVDAEEDSGARLAGLTPGSRLGAYELNRELGRGGMGRVMHARRLADGKESAIKMLLVDAALSMKHRAMFRREIDSLRALSHKNITEIYDHGTADDGLWFAMELCSGGSVDDLMRQGGPMEAPQAVRIIDDALQGLAHAHKLGYIHRDIKPQNILLDAQGTAKIADLGLAKSYQQAGVSGNSVTGEAAGTIDFMCRDQLTNYKYARPDVDTWSMAATLYAMLTGSAPREAVAGEDPVLGVLTRNAIPIRARRSVPEHLARVIDRALLDDSATRYADAESLRLALLGAGL